MTSANHITQTPRGAVVMIRSIEDQKTTAVDLSFLAEHSREPQDIRTAIIREKIPGHRLAVGDTVLIDLADTGLQAGEIYAVKASKGIRIGRIWQRSGKVEILGRVFQLMLGDV